MSNEIVYRPDIDGLRAIAVLSVVFCHSGIAMPGGFIGVDVFFVISGFLISSIILRDLESGRFTFAEFWERRVRRIVPALLVVVVATMGAGWFVLLPDAFQNLGNSVLALVGLISNVYFWRTTDYFDTAAEEKPLLHTWSLAVEEQFYLAIPLIMYFMYRRGFQRRLAVLFWTAIAISLGLSVIGAFKRPVGTFYLLPTRAWELLLGCVLAMRIQTSVGIQTSTDDRVLIRIGRTWMRELLAACGLVLIAIPCFLYSESTPFPGLTAIPPVLGSILIIGTSTNRSRTAVARLLASPPLVFVGLISYSLYLWHWPIFAFVRYLAFRPLSLFENITLIVAGFVFAILSWRYVETPFRRKHVLGNRRRLMIVAAANGLLVFGIGIGIVVTNGMSYRLTGLAERYNTTIHGDERWARALDVEDVPDHLLEFGVVGNSPNVLVWGDSHARAILPAVHDACVKHNCAGVAAIRSATAPALGVLGRSHLGGNERAIPFAAAVFEMVVAHQIEVVVMAAYWDIYSKDDDFGRQLSMTIRQLTERGVRVYVVEDVPRYTFNPARFTVQFAHVGLDLSPLNLTRAEHERNGEWFQSMKDQLARSGGKILHPAHYLPANSNSSAFVPFDEGGCLYQDSHHLSVYGAHFLVPMFEDANNGLFASMTSIVGPNDN